MEGKRIFKVVIMGLLILLGGLLLCIKPNKSYSNSLKGQSYLSKVDKETGVEGEPTYLGVAYLDPTNLAAECNYSNSIGATNGDKTGCMRFYIIGETNTTYKLLLDHNTSENIQWISKTDYVDSFESEADKETAETNFNNLSYTDKGAITANKQLAADTAGWAGNPKLVSAEMIKTIINNQTWTASSSANVTLGNDYGWLIDKTSNCSNVGCVVNEPSSSHNGYWTTTAQEGNLRKVWAVNHEGTLLKSDADLATSYGIRPYIELRKDLVAGAFDLNQDAFDNATNGVSVVSGEYCLGDGTYKLTGDITLDKNINLSVLCGLADETNVVIDLNGYTLTIGDKEFAIDSTKFKLTGTGEVVSNGTALLINGGTVTLDDSITYTGMLDIRGGTTTIDGISVNSTTYALEISEGANVTINHGDFNGNTYGLLMHGGTTQITSASFTGTASAVAITDTMSFEDLLVNPNVFNDIDSSSDYIESDGFKKLNVTEASVGIKTTYTLDFDAYNVDENGRVLFTNANIVPGVEVKVGDDVLVKDTDYTVEYKNNKNVGEASVVIKRISTSTYAFANKTLKFEIYKIAMDMDDLEVTVENPNSYEYTGSAIIPTYSLSYNSTAVSNDNFDLTAENNVNAGTATYTLTLKDSSIYASENVKTFTVTIKKKALAENSLSLQTGSAGETYTGSAITFDNIQLQYSGEYLAPSNYTISYADNVNVGTASVIATSTDSSNYSFVKTETFNINPKSLDENNIELNHYKFEYTGIAIEPEVTVTDGTTVVSKNDYVVTIAGDNVNIGSTATVQVQSLANKNYTFNETIAFEITDVGSVTLQQQDDNALGAKVLNSEDDLNTIIPLTLDETSARAAGDEIVVYVEVEVIEASDLTDDKNAILATLEDNNLVYKFLNINLYKKVGDNAPVKVSAPTGKIKIQFDVPEALLNNKDVLSIYILRLHNGVVTRIPVVIVDGKGVIETDAFSTYALAYQVKPEEKKEEAPASTPSTDSTTETTTEITTNPKTGDNILNITVIMIICMASMLYINIRKKLEM